MAVVWRPLDFLIREVVVYAGHSGHPTGPYSGHLAKRIHALSLLNTYRMERGRPPWNVRQIKGEELMDSLGDPKHTLLAFPAEPSSFLDKVFTDKQITFLRRKFFELGGRGYFTCGSAYWVTRVRGFHDVWKESRMPLLEGVARGPICRYQPKSPTVKWNNPFLKEGDSSSVKGGRSAAPDDKLVSSANPPLQGGDCASSKPFKTDAVTLQSGKESCTMYLSGGGSFRTADPRVRVLARYPHAELERVGIPRDRWALNDIASVLTPVGKGAAALLMSHPYFGADDWPQLKQRLSPEGVRMRFLLDNILHPLEDSTYGSSALCRHQSLYHPPRQTPRAS